MKFLAALLATAAAAATAKTGCKVKLSYYEKADTDCSKTATDETINVIVGTCQYSATKKKWFKIKSCTTYQVEMHWHKDDVVCATDPTKLDKIAYSSTGVCTKSAITSTDTAEFFSKTAKAESVADTNKLCDFQFEAFEKADGTCDTASSANLKKITDLGFTDKRTPYIVGECYPGGDNDWAVKVKSCAKAADYEIEVHDKKDCSNVKHSYKGAETATATKKCMVSLFGLTNVQGVWLGTIKYDADWTISKIEEGKKPEEKKADGAKTLAAGALAALSMMYL